jgi:hypothetical protein
MKKDTQKAQTRATKKERLASSTSAAALLPTEAERPLDQAQEQALAKAADELSRIDRNTTSDAFERGRHFRTAKAILRERRFGTWLKQHTSYTVRSAWNYISVDDKLAWHRPRCEAVSIPPTSLFILATAEDERVVQDVLASFERGERLTGARIKKMIALTRKEPVVEAQPMNVGGLSGFLKAAELRNKSEAASFDALARSVLKVLEDAVAKITAGKHVTKKGLSDAIEYDARHIGDYLKTMLGPMMGQNLPGFHHWEPGEVSRDLAWGHAQAVFNKLGVVEDWPDRTYFNDWLLEKVLPVVRFVVHGEELVGFEAKRVVERVIPDDEVDNAEVTDPDDTTVVAIDIERQKRQGPEAEAA